MKTAHVTLSLVLPFSVAFAPRAAAQCETTQLTASDVEDTDVFGWCVDIRGDRAIVGAIGDDDVCPGNPNCQSGAAYVFERRATGWVEAAKLVAGDPEETDEFGQDVAIHGDRALVGAHKKTEGAAYVYLRTPTGWVQEQKLQGSGTLNNFHFGHAVSLYEDTALIGTMRDSHAGSQAGSAFLFERVLTGWVETVKLTASDAAAGDRFGRSVDLAPNVAVAAAHLHDEVGADSGTVYVYERDDGGTPANPLDDTWPEIDKLVPSDAAAGDLFGRGVGISGTTIVVGAAQDEVGAVATGSAYIFERMPTGWVETQKLLADDGEANDLFGQSVSIDGNRVLVGARGDDDGGTDAGATYVFERDGGAFVQTMKLVASDALGGDFMGEEVTVALSGDNAFVGAPFNDAAVDNGGSAYVIGLGENGSVRCSAKRSSLGCRPFITCSGAPTLTGADDFFVNAGNVIGRTGGFLVFGLRPSPSGAGVGFSEIGISPHGTRLCMMRPQIASALQSSGGTAGLCDGNFSFAFPQASLAALGGGTRVFAQVVYRDPAHPDGTGLGHTEAFEFVVCRNPDAVLAECGATFYVDDDALPGGDGSSLSPFQTIREGIEAAAFPANRVVVRDGTYSGPDNRALDFGGVDIVVRSANGPASCTIDLGGVARAFEFTSGETSAAVLRGFTITGGLAAGGPLADRQGGAIRIAGATPTIRDCIITDCVAEQGGAIFSQAGAALIEECTFRDNTALNGGAGIGGGVVAAGATVIRKCRFEGNTSTLGAGLLASGNFNVIVSHCEFLGNTGSAVLPALSQGGGVNGLVQQIDNCLFAGNTADEGGGFYMPELASAGGSYTITSSTFVANDALGGGGGGLYLRDVVFLDNTIVYGNTATGGGPQILLGVDAMDDAHLTVTYSDVQGGQAAVLVEEGTLSFPAGDIDTDPLYVDADGADDDPGTFDDNDYRLSASSPCLDAGTTDLALDVADVDDDGVTAEPVPFDLDLNPRQVDDPAVDTGNGTPPVDIGAYERQ